MTAKIRCGDKVKYFPMEVAPGKGVWVWVAVASDRTEEHRGLRVGQQCPVRQVEYRTDRDSGIPIVRHTRPRDGYALLLQSPTIGA